MPIESPDKERATIAAFADQANSGVILLWDSLLAIRRASILATAGYYHVPTITDALSCEDGTGLINYGPDAVEVYRGAASYVDRILKGAKPIDLPVQMPSKFSLRMNLRLARYMGLTIPASFVRTADEVWD